MNESCISKSLLEHSEIVNEKKQGGNIFKTSYSLKEEFGEPGEGGLGSKPTPDPRQRILDHRDTTQFLHFFASKSKFLYIFNLETKQLEQHHLLNNFLVPIHHRSYSNQHGFIFLTGGIDTDNNIMRKCFILDNNEGEKELFEMEPMNQGRAFHSMICVGDQIVVVGGIDNTKELLNSMEIYNSESNQWEVRSPCHTKSIFHALIQKENLIIKVGGKQQQDQLSNSLEVYNLDSNVWTLIGNTGNQEVPSSLTGFYHDNQVYIFGGT